MAELGADRKLILFQTAQLPDKPLPHQLEGEPSLRAASQPFQDLAHWIVENLPATPERTLALDALFEAKNYAVCTLVKNCTGRDETL